MKSGDEEHAERTLSRPGRRIFTFGASLVADDVTPQGLVYGLGLPQSWQSWAVLAVLGPLFTPSRLMCLYSRLMADGTIFCNRCGTQNSASARFCANCGTSFSAELQPAAPPPVTPEVSSQSPSPVWQPAPVSYAAPVATTRYGGFWIRFVAAVIDGILVELVVLPVGAVVGGMIGLAGSAVAMPGIGIHMVSAITGAALGLLGNWIYEAAMESSSKQATLGKMALGLKVTDLEGRRISFARATGRHFSKFLSGMILLIGYIMAGFTERKQALHDMIAGTLVQRTP